MLRAFVESHWSDPLLHSQYVPSPQPRVDWLIPAPYVDNGEAHSLERLEEAWAAERQRAGFFNSARAVAAAAAAHDATPPAVATASPPPERNVTVFFGGRTSTRIGPGHAQMGYYTRWALMRQWSQHSADGALAQGASEQLMVVDSDRDPANFLRNGQPARDVPAAPFCDTQTVIKVKGGDSDSGAKPRAVPSAAAAAALLKFESYYEHQIGRQRACVPSCEYIDVNHATHGVCHGKYQPGPMLLRSRFALCLRGDIPTSPRPYDAVR